MSKESGVLRDSADLGTPSAPPIFDVPSDGRSTEVEDQQQQASDVFADDDQYENVTCLSRESAGYEPMREGFGNWKSDSVRTAELGERYCQKKLLFSFSSVIV